MMMVERQLQIHWTFWTNNENSSPDEFTLLTPEEGEETILTPTFTWTESMMRISTM